MSRTLRAVLGAVAGAAVAVFFFTDRGRRWREQAETKVLPHLKESGGWIKTELTQAGAPPEEVEDAVQQKISEIRSRMNEGNGDEATEQDA
ncbi:MAG TPA: hypothetical protein VFE20_08955 [Thermoleophilia bacterium]|nr:hypothetical protein [Thermoleophilia bacterium]